MAHKNQYKMMTSGDGSTPPSTLVLSKLITCQPAYMQCDRTEVPKCYHCEKTMPKMKPDWRTRKYHRSCMEILFGSNDYHRLMRRIKKHKFPDILSVPVDQLDTDDEITGGITRFSCSLAV